MSVLVIIFGFSDNFKEKPIFKRISVCKGHRHLKVIKFFSYDLGKSFLSTKVAVLDHF